MPFMRVHPNDSTYVHHIGFASFACQCGKYTHLMEMDNAISKCPNCDRIYRLTCDVFLDVDSVPDD